MKKNVQDTSLEAYKEIQPKLSERHEEILEAIEHLTKKIGDCTDFETAQFLGKGDPNYVRPRRYELVNEHKLVGFAQKRRCEVTGKKAMAWKTLKRIG